MTPVDLSKWFIGMKRHDGVYELVRMTNAQHDIEWIRREQRDRSSNSETKAETSGQ